MKKQPGLKFRKSGKIKEVSIGLYYEENCESLLELQKLDCEYVDIITFQTQLMSIQTVNMQLKVIKGELCFSYIFSARHRMIFPNQSSIDSNCLVRDVLIEKSLVWQIQGSVTATC